MKLSSKSRTRTSLFAVVCLTALALGLGGCVYLRLLGLMGQLANWERYVEMSRTPDLVLSLRRPTVTDRDLRALGMEPKSSEATSDGKIWKVVMERRLENETKDAQAIDLFVHLRFHESKLVEVIFPKRYLTIFDTDFVASLLGALGKARINPVKRRVIATWLGEASALEKVSPERLRETLGTPDVWQSDAEHIRLKYNYRMLSPNSTANKKLYRRYWTEFTFDRQRLRLLRAESKSVTVRFVALP